MLPYDDSQYYTEVQYAKRWRDGMKSREGDRDSGGADIWDPVCLRLRTTVLESRTLSLLLKSISSSTIVGFPVFKIAIFQYVLCAVFLVLCI